MKNLLLTIAALLLAASAWAWNTPSISGPSDGATTWTGVTLDWNAVNNSQFYQVQLDTTPTFNSPTLRSVNKAYINSASGNGDTRDALTDLIFGQTYYWRVRAWITGDTSAWTAVRTFTTRDFVNVVSPATGATTWTGTRLNWDAHDGVAKYQWQADTSAAFNSPMLLDGLKNYINTSDGNADTEHSFRDILFGATYHWRVRAINNHPDTSAWSGVRTFTTRNFVNLASPADGALNRNVAGFNLDWDAHPGVRFYQVQMDINGAFASPLISATTTYINTVSSNADTRYPTGALQANTIYFWRVRAWNDVDTSAWTTWAFSTGSTPIVYPNAPTLVAPANASSIVGSGTTLQWSAVSGATSYLYEYANNPGFSNAITGTSTATSVAISGLLGSSTYYWRVRTMEGNLPSAYSTVWTFSTPTGTISTNNPPAPAYCSGEPITISFGSTSTFTGSSTYTLQLSDANGSFANPTNIGTATGANVTLINGTLPAGAATGSGYKVRVVSTQPNITGTPNPNAFGIVNTSTPPVITGTTGTACVGATVTLSVPTMLGVDYLWLLPDSSTQPNSSITINNFSSANAGQYGVIIAVGSCFAPPAFVQINLGAGPTTPVVTSNANAICQGATLSLGTAAQTNATYAWSGPNNFTSTLQNPSLTMPANGAGTYSVTVTQNGCTATGSKAITLVLPVSSTVSQTICFGQSFAGYNASGTYTDTFTAANGCDSVRTLNLTVRPQNATTVNQTICFGQSFAGYSASGVYTDTYTGSNGCDSTRTLNLTVSPQITSTVNRAICSGQSYAGYTTAGTYTDTYTATNGCDSIRTLNLTVVSQITTTLNETICFGQSFAGYSTAGTYTDTYTSSGGCDSIRTLNLTISPQNTTSISQTICFGQSFAGYTASGTYTDTYTAANGCDSIRTLVLTVRPQNASVINQNICPGESFEGYTTAGTYTDTYAASNGCDSVRTLILTVDGITINETVTSCSNDTLILNGIRVTASGIYDVTVPSTTGGCDTLFVYDVTIFTSPDVPVIELDDLTGDLVVIDGSISLQWFKDGVAIPGEIFTNLTPTGNGVYSVVASQLTNTCTSVSNFINIGTGIGQLPSNNFKVYPMPTTGLLNIGFTQADASRTVSVRDITGKEVRAFEVPQSIQQIDLSELASGMYMLHVSSSHFSGIYKIVKE